MSKSREAQKARRATPWGKYLEAKASRQSKRRRTGQPVYVDKWLRRTINAVLRGGGPLTLFGATVSLSS
jgi:hypothetical protein